MNFWKTVIDELEYIGMNRKQLANEAGFDVSNIGKGLKNGNVPAADTAVKIAQVLGVSVEYLVTGKKNENTTQNPVVRAISQDLNYLSDDDIKIVKLLVRRMRM